MTDDNRGGARPGPQALSSAISAVLTMSATAAGAQEQAPRRNRARRGHRHRDQARGKLAGRLRVDHGVRLECDRDAWPEADRRHRQIHTGHVALAARAGRHDDRIPRRRELPASSSARSRPRRSTWTSSRSRRAGGARTRASSTSSASRRCVARRAHCTGRARSLERCASSPPSPIPPVSTPGPRQRSPASRTVTRVTTSAQC